jgi:hypothetical protein
MPSSRRDRDALRLIEMRLRQDDRDFVDLFDRIERVGCFASQLRPCSEAEPDAGNAADPDPRGRWFARLFWSPRSLIVAGLESLVLSSVVCFLLDRAARAESLPVQLVLMLCLPIALVPLARYIRCPSTSGS